ncbi:MAG TPA: hypothetical protein VGY77_09755 [Gemmataceae bacterium]|jgi:hypothetical protein|nr:hypothetical protein [Gemmataceae bacterium]
MTVGKITETLIEGLKQALAEPKEQLLFRSGKLSGLFPNRTGVYGEAAAQALREGLLEVIRTDTKGKTTLEWVRANPRAVDWVHRQESPIQPLKELQAALHNAQENISPWLNEFNREMQSFGAKLMQEAQRWSHRLETLSQRVENALLRLEAGQIPEANGVTSGILWAAEALAYLDRRREGGAGENCPLPELFVALRSKQADLSVKVFHEGLRRLHDRRAIRLIPFPGTFAELPEPEYALLDGAVVLYYATR